MRGGTAYREYMGCIKIENNVFIGANATILADVHIGSNVIIGAGTLVNKDLEGGYVYAGVPARRICSFEEFVRKRECQVSYPEGLGRKGDFVPYELADFLWENYKESKEKQIEG